MTLGTRIEHNASTGAITTEDVDRAWILSTKSDKVTFTPSGPVAASVNDTVTLSLQLQNAMSEDLTTTRTVAIAVDTPDNGIIIVDVEIVAGEGELEVEVLATGTVNCSGFDVGGAVRIEVT